MAFALPVFSYRDPGFLSSRQELSVHFGPFGVNALFFDEIVRHSFKYS